MKKQRKISVVMSVYNAERFLAEAVESVLRQTFDDFEFIIVDDGSDDGSAGIVSRYGDERITYIRCEHDFVRTLNTGMERAGAPYIVRMDADDMMMPERLRIQYDYMEAHADIGVCGSNFQMIRANGEVLGQSALATEDKDLKGLLFQLNPIANPTTIIRKSCIDELLKKNGTVYRPEYVYAEDYGLWTDLACMGVRFANLPEVLLKYRKSEGQVTNRHYNKVVQQSRRVRNTYFNTMAGRLVERHPAYFGVWNELIKLSNERLIGFEDLGQMARILYLNARRQPAE